MTAAGRVFFSKTPSAIVRSSELGLRQGFENESQNGNYKETAPESLHSVTCSTVTPRYLKQN
jgi:hypothetical protein